MSYNGWTNRATWNVSLWVSNSEPSYNIFMKKCRELVTDGGDWNESNTRLFAKRIFGDTTPDGDKLGSVNWHELAQAWREDTNWIREEEK